MPKLGQKFVKKSTEDERIDWVYKNVDSTQFVKILFVRFSRNEEVDLFSDEVRRAFFEMRNAGLYAPTTYWKDCKASVARAIRLAFVKRKFDEIVLR